MEIVDLLSHPELIPTIVGWIEGEWPHSGRDRDSVEFRLCGYKEPGKLPWAMVAVEKRIPVGFVSLVYFDKGLLEGRPYWIDAVYVEPTHRRQGLALRLIKAAEAKAPSLGVSRLFALTPVSALYLRAGWVIEKKAPTLDPKDVVVKKDLEKKISLRQS